MTRDLSFILLLALMAVAGCAAQPRAVVPENSLTHDHLRPNTKSIGDYHAHLHVYHRQGKMSLYISDIDENPLPLGESAIDAEMTLPNGDRQKIVFESENFSVRHGHYFPSDVFSVSGEWVATAYAFDIKVMIPIRSKIYEASFDYETSYRQHRHHGR